MDTTVIARCPHCGAVDVAGPEVTVVRPGEGYSDGWWRFVCPTCLDTVWHTAGAEALEFLTGRGAIEAAERDAVAVPWTEAGR
jgi:hypothetical protein